jgi:HAD superfamily hydrolase (TIGR01459 family)
MKKLQSITGMAELVARYDGFILDQWGVLHDGKQIYPGVIECLERLSKLGRRVVLLSNSGKRAALNRTQLSKLGLPGELYIEVISSGEITWNLLAKRTDPFFQSLGRHCLLYSHANDRSVVDELDLVVVDRLESAEFILLAGIDSDCLTLADFEPLLASSLQRNLPLLCANSDTVGISGNRQVLTPGAVAKRYAELGGTIRLVGKPHPTVYKPCLKTLCLPSERIVAIGDSLMHDIAGGVGVGLATTLVTGGIHSTCLASGISLSALCAYHQMWPDWILPMFRW